MHKGSTAIEVLAEYDSAERAERYPHPRRILIAIRLANDLETCRELLQGTPVPPERLNQRELARARNKKLVRLDFHEIDHLQAA